MRTYYVLLSIAIISLTTVSHAQTRIPETSTVFASVTEGRRILMARDDFIRRLSPFDRSARMKSDKDITEEDFLTFVGNSVLTWNEREKQKVETAIRGIEPYFSTISLPLPEKIYMIKTSGKEEGGASYTRANAVVIPKAKLEEGTPEIQKLICHELFHIATRRNPTLQERLYESIGFRKCNEIEFPSMLKSRKITNPDAPKNDHYIPVQVGGRPVWVIPVLFSSRERYDINRGGEFFDYLQFHLLLVARDRDRGAVTPLYKGSSHVLLGVREVAGFFEQVGENTDYVIHPEEILADNFALLLLRHQTVRTPEILDKISAILLKK